MEKSCIAESIAFTCCDFQVTRGKFMSSAKAPMITFGDFKVWANAACIKKFPGINYVQFGINSDEKKAILRPCSENAKDSLVWCIDKDNIRKPRKVICRLLVARLLELMDWDVESRYRIIGDFVSTDSEKLMLFDLNSAERVHSLKVHSNFIGSTEIISEFPEELRDNFKLPIKEHSRLTKRTVFKDYTVFTLDKFGGT